MYFKLGLVYYKLLYLMNGNVVVCVFYGVGWILERLGIVLIVRWYIDILKNVI